MAAKHINRINLQRAIVDILPPENGRNAGLTTLDIYRCLEEHFAEGKNYQANRRKLERELKDLVKECRVCVGDSKTKPYRYFRSVAEDEEEFDSLMWSYTVEHIESHLKSVLPQKKLETAVKRLQDPDLGFRLSDAIFRIAPDTLTLMPAEFKPAILVTVLRALVEGRAIRVVYQYRDGTRGHPVLHPQGALQSGPRFFLFVLVDNENVTVETYALHRFISVELLDAPARKTADFDLEIAVKKRAANDRDVRTIRLVVLTRGFVTDLLRDCPMNTDQIISEDYKYPGFDARVSVTVPMSLLLERWLIGRSPDVLVLEPRDLADRIARKSRQTALLYGNYL